MLSSLVCLHDDSSAGARTVRLGGPREIEGGPANLMASAGARAYMGVWGLCPQWGPGAKPQVRGSGASPP